MTLCTQLCAVVTFTHMTSEGEVTFSGHTARKCFSAQALPHSTELVLSGTNWTSASITGTRDGDELDPTGTYESPQPNAAPPSQLCSISEKQRSDGGGGRAKR